MQDRFHLLHNETLDMVDVTGSQAGQGHTYNYICFFFSLKYHYVILAKCTFQVTLVLFFMLIFEANHYIVTVFFFFLVGGCLCSPLFPSHILNILFNHRTHKKKKRIINERARLNIQHATRL